MRFVVLGAGLLLAGCVQQEYVPPPPIELQSNPPITYQITPPYRPPGPAPLAEPLPAPTPGDELPSPTSPAPTAVAPTGPRQHSDRRRHRHRADAAHPGAGRPFDTDRWRRQQRAARGLSSHAWSNAADPLTGCHPRPGFG
jgi:hypothetical protein